MQHITTQASQAFWCDKLGFAKRYFGACKCDLSVTQSLHPVGATMITGVQWRGLGGKCSLWVANQQIQTRGNITAQKC